MVLGLFSGIEFAACRVVMAPRGFPNFGACQSRFYRILLQGEQEFRNLKSRESSKQKQTGSLLQNELTFISSLNKANTQPHSSTLHSPHRLHQTPHQFLFQCVSTFRNSQVLSQSILHQVPTLNAHRKNQFLGFHTIHCTVSSTQWTVGRRECNSQITTDQHLDP